VIPIVHQPRTGWRGITRTALAACALYIGFTARADIINVPGDQPTIQDAINVAVDGDEVVVAPGTYFEQINLLGKPITVRSSGGLDVTTIDGGGAGDVVTCANSEDPETVLQGFSVTGGDVGVLNDHAHPTVTDCTITAAKGIVNLYSSPTITDCTITGAVSSGMQNLYSSPTVTNCTFSDNSAGISGAGMYNHWSSSPTVINCTFSGNAAVSIGGGMSNSPDCNPTVINCTFSQNTANVGGGMYNGQGASPVVANCTFIGNTAASGGGMANSYGASTYVSVTDCMFTGNSAGSAGGGIWTLDGSQTAVTDCTFVGNAASSGGGIFNGGNVSLSGCVFKANQAVSGDGGGMYNDGAAQVTGCTFASNTTAFGAGQSGGGMYNTQGASPVVTNCTFGGNLSALGGGMGNAGANPVVIGSTFLNNIGADGGGGLYSQSGTTAVINCTFGANHGGDGAALHLRDGTDVFAITNCVFSGNNAGSDQGGAVYVNNSDATIANCSFWLNSTSGASGGAVYSLDSTVTASSCILWQNIPDQAAEAGLGSMTLLYCDVEDGWSGSGEGNIDADPLFVYPHGPDAIPGTADDDLRLSVDSPGIDAGDNNGLCCDQFDLDENGVVTELVPLDRAGNPRRLEVLVAPDTGNGLPPVVDIGAYEFDAGTPLSDTPLRVWVGASPQDPSGVFDVPGHWLEALMPGAGNVAVFDIDALYVVSFQSGPVTDQLNVRRGDALFDLSGHTYTVTSGDLEAFVVGELPGVATALTIANGSIVAGSAVIGFQDSYGTVRIAGPGASLDLAVLGVVNSGQLIVEPGCSVNAPGGALSVFQQGMVSGDGLVSAYLMANFGTVSPGENGPGALQITGSYHQIGEIPPAISASGALIIELSDTGHDVLNVDGEALLAGGLFVELIGDYLPGVGESFTILNATTIPTIFDVAFMPGLPDGRFMRVQYGAAGAGAAETATIIVENLESLFGFDNPVSEPIAGLPSDVAVGDFDNQDGLDLAITIPDPDPANPGTVLVLLNAGTDALGNWRGFAGSTQTTVGRDPSGITVGLLDAGTDLDIAVTNAGDDDVMVLLNDGLGTFNVQPSVGVGDQPSDLAAADFDGDTTIDLVVTNAGDDNVHFLANDGSGVMALSSIADVGVSPYAVDPSDIDEDKDPDALVANRDSDDISLLLNLGGGNFDPPVNIDVGDAPVDLAVGDFDNNFLDDLVTANTGDGTVSVVLNNGGGTFAPAVNLPVGDLPRSLTTIDLEGDSDIDIAVVADDELGNAVVQVLRNDLDPGQGQLIFADAAKLDAGQDPVLVTTGDLDNDDKDDLITVNEGLGAAAAVAGPGGPGSVNVLLNDPCPWDCGNNDDDVGVVDFLAMLAQWGQVGASCDFDDDGVSVADFLALLANWGPCP
jgi:hypothetical protein